MMTRGATPRGKIVVTGMCCYLPIAGVIYQVLHYLIGLRQLGYDAWYVEDSGRWPYDLAADDITRDASKNVGMVAAVLEANGFQGRWAFRGDYEGGRCYGLDAEQIRRLYRDADALLNVTGQEIREDQLSCRFRVYIESDPFATQVKVVQGDQHELARLAAHHVHFTFGENIGAPDCRIPPDGFHWLPTRQPVALELWPPDATAASNGRADYTTITSWINHVESIEYQGEFYHWQKDREFEKFLDLPRRSTASFELATKVDEDIGRRLNDHGWRHVPSDDLSANLQLYRDYILHSRAEFTVARDQYVRPRTGWFSDRSACYLAAGRPVITQETAFSKFLPTGCGLFAFTSMEEILAAVHAIDSDYETHSRAARELAHEYFAADKVVGSLLERAGA